MKPEPLRVASPQFTRKRLMLRGLCDAFCVLKYGLYSPVTRCEPLNYRRWVKEKNRNSVLCARARAFSPVSPPSLLASAWVSNAVGAMGGKLPDKSKKCPRLEPFAPPFFGRNDVVRASAGGGGDCAAPFLRWARRALLPLPECLHTSGGARFAAEQWEAEVSVFIVWGRNGLEIHCDVRKNVVVFLA